MSDMVTGALDIVQVLSAILVFLLGVGFLAIVVMFIVDRTQTRRGPSS